MDFNDVKRGRLELDLKRGRTDSDYSRRGKNYFEDLKRGKSESEGHRRDRNELESNALTGSKLCSKGYSKYLSKNTSDTDKHRERHKVHPRSRRSESPHH